MGISGLLQFIKDAAEPVHVKKYKDQTVAVDTYCWLHKGAFSCAEKLAKGEPTDQYVWYCMKFVDMLLSFRVKPILVFDGRNLPSKQEVERARRERREANLQKGRQLLREGRLSEARDCFTRCINVTPAMAHNLIKVARARGVDCVVAPYEADAQLAFLTKVGLAQAVITEDSDLLAFGCRKVILKMDKQGNGLEVQQVNLGRCRSLGNVFTEEKFRYMCILSGCDYLSSLHGIGLGKACKLLRLAKDPDILKVIRKMGQYLKMNLVVPESYVEGFVRANNTFLYQLVFDPVHKKVVPLNPYPAHVDPTTLSYAGLHPGDGQGLQMALGNLDINTLQRIDDFDPDKAPLKTGKARTHSWSDSPLSSGPSVWSTGFSTCGAALPQPATSPDRPLPTRGQERVMSLQGGSLPVRELQVKRPRQAEPADSSAAEQDLLQQYSSSSSPKRRRSQPGADTPTGTHQLRTRNRFATGLQRRNLDAEEDEGEATCSRFFSRSSPTSPSTQLPARPAVSPSVPPPTTQSQDSDGPEVSSVETPSPPLSPGSAGPGLRLFHWWDRPAPPQHPEPAGPGLAELGRFHYRTPRCPLAVNAQRTAASPHPQTDVNTRSPLSHCRTSCPQSQPQLPEEAVPTAPPCRTDMSAGNSSPVSPGAGPLVSKVPPSSKQRSGEHTAAVGVQRLGPARASGLRRRPPPSNSENNPGIQATIKSLWRNFSFNKYEKKPHVSV